MFQNLFAFGDIDGKGIAAKLQHPLGVCFSAKENCVYVADTYNHKIKRIDATSNECETCNIVEESKNVMVFNEPGGLCLNPTGDLLFVVNTNNHSIESVDLSTMTSKTLKITFNAVPQTNINEQIVTFQTVKMSPQGGDLKFNVTLNLSTDIYFTTGAPQKWLVKPLDERWSIKTSEGTSFDHQPLNIEFSVSSGSSLGSDNIVVSFQLNLCAGDVCFAKRFALHIPIVYGDNEPGTIDENVSINISRDSVQL